MSWRCVYRFMEKMGVGLEKIRVKKRGSSEMDETKVEKVPVDESGIETS